MTTNRKRVSRLRAPDIDPALLAWFKDAIPRRPALVFFMLEGELQKAWDASRDDVLAGWTQTNPGTRPVHWWIFDAPELRQRISGKPYHETLAYAPAFNLGIPERSDPADYESQAAFLKRHKLLLPGEKLSVDAMP